MSPFVPTEFDHSVNVSKVHPLKEVARLLLGCAVVIVAVYVLINFLLELALPHISVKTENWIWDQIAISDYTDKPLSKDLQSREKYLQTLLDKIPATEKPEGYDFKVHLQDSEDINAYAMPGGNIIVTTALLDSLETENALMFVLGHELGHFASRDHLRSMGSGVAGILVAIAVTGQSDVAGHMLSGISQLTSLVYSRRAEEKADLWGLRALQAVYGHSGGATSFFEIMQKKEGKLEAFVPGIFRTHPLDQKRIDALNQEIETQHYKVLEPVALSP